MHVGGMCIAVVITQAQVGVHISWLCMARDHPTLHPTWHLTWHPTWTPGFPESVCSGCSSAAASQDGSIQLHQLGIHRHLLAVKFSSSGAESIAASYQIWADLGSRVIGWRPRPLPSHRSSDGTRLNSEPRKHSAGTYTSTTGMSF